MGGAWKRKGAEKRRGNAEKCGKADEVKRPVLGGLPFLFFISAFPLLFSAPLRFIYPYKPTESVSPRSAGSKVVGC